jgi:hemerythrin superfamily protein
MPTARTTRAASDARSQIFDQLKKDHKRVKAAYREFEKLDPSADAETCALIVEQVLAELTVHSTLEEELLYPAAREAMKDPSLVDEAEVEHESAHALIDQLSSMNPDDDKYAARFTVLCEYVLHHVKEEEGELFPQLEGMKLDWEDLHTRMQERRAELQGSGPESDAAETGAEDDESGGSGSSGKRQARTARPASARAATRP